MNNYDDARLTALRLLKGMFKNYVNDFDVFEDKDFAYECAVKRIQLLVGMSLKMKSYNGMTLKYWG